MIDFDAVIRHFGPQAVTLLHTSEYSDADRIAFQVMKPKSALVRVDEIRKWLRTYGVFRGILDSERTRISAAVLEWADSREVKGKLATADAICEAHESLNAACVKAYERKRDFTSLASKALWLRYPEDVPLFDSRAQCALWIFSKLESGISPPDNASEYRQFVHIWKAFYERYEGTINELDMRNYPYPVRVFDVILWIVGAPQYKSVL